jgi:hypothetical protein
MLGASMLTLRFLTRLCSVWIVDMTFFLACRCWYDETFREMETLGTGKIKWRDWWDWMAWDDRYDGTKSRL